MSASKDFLARPVAWLLGSRTPVSWAIKAQLEAGLFTSMPIFIGGVFNSIAIAAVAAWRHPTPLFLTWLGWEIVLALIRLPLIARGREALRDGKRPPLGTAALLACAWACSVGYGAFISIRAEDWVLATIVCLSAAAMVCGVCLRNFGTPRLAATMVLLMLGPSAMAGLFAADRTLMVISLQLPIFILTIFSSAFALHQMFVSRMDALNDLRRSEGLNRSILEASQDYTLILDDKRNVVFLNRPGGPAGGDHSMQGVSWLSLLHPDNHEEGLRVLGEVAAGRPANLTTRYVDEEGETRWFDVIASPIADGSGRTMVVARDMTHQKASEAQAVWMARHDVLTGLANRSMLQQDLERRLRASAKGDGAALLIVDVDHFKTINDTLGHDAGDVLLCTFADRLRAAAAPDDLVTRTGGDEFAILVAATTLEEVESAAERIFANLREPLLYQGRLLECSASIGASILLRDGQTRSEVMKAADLALYAAKANGRGQMRIFDRTMQVEVDRQQAMVEAGRKALLLDRIVPYYQPKVSLRTWEIVGFEALLRWTDDHGDLRLPDEMRAAFEDTRLAAELGDQMITSVLDQMRAWTEAGVKFGHVAINITPSDFRRSGFADDLLRALAERDIDPSLLQLEVTETVFLGRAAGYVETALRTLSAHGVRIVLDDFGTGYASLSHLNQFPVDLLKIDGAFVHELGRKPEAEAITAAVINLGHCLGMEVVAEGVEEAAQEERLVQLGCDTVQGFLYSRPMPAQDVPQALASAAISPQRLCA